MRRIENTVFISYRRTNIGFALAIYQNLTHRGYNVFFDFESIGAGDFEQIILRSIESRAHFVVILTPSALERCNQPGDWLRREIEHALKHRRNIIPLTFEGFDFTDIQRYLPPPIAEPLSRYNGLRVPTDFFNEAMTKLTLRLNTPLDAVLHPPSLPPSAAVRAEEFRQQQVVAAEPSVTRNALSAQEYFERGLKHHNLANYDFALADYNEALLLLPDFVEAYNNRGLVKYQQGDYDGAIKDYDQVIRRKPDFAESYHNRGLARHSRGDYDGAIEDYNQTLNLNPAYALAYHHRGLSKASKGDHDMAIANFSQTLRLRPDFAAAYYFRGIAKAHKHDYDGAIHDFSQAIRYKRDYAAAYYSRGIARAHKGHHRAAISDYTDAIRLRPGFAEAYNNRGGVKYEKRDYNGAIADAEAALRINPKLQTARTLFEIAQRAKNAR